MKKRVSQRDIARRLGVNVSTVSRALNGLPGVSSELRQEIERLAMQQDYQPNPFAMSLRYDTTHTIGIVVPDMSFNHFAHIVKWIEAEARKKGYIPADCHFKVSAHSGHGNPCSAHVLETLGADSINPVRDIQVQMLAAMRAAIDVPIDLHTENPKSSGGFIRHYEVPDFIRVAAPVYLKTGGSVAANHSYDTTEKEAKQRAKQVSLVKRVIDTYYPEAIVSPK